MLHAMNVNMFYMHDVMYAKIMFKSSKFTLTGLVGCIGLCLMLSMNDT